MGMFKSYNQLKAQTKEIQRTAPPMADRMADMQARMEQVNVTMSVAPDPSAVIGRGQVLGARDTGTQIQMQNLVEVSLLVTLPGLPPRPVTTQLTVSVLDAGRLTPGAIVAVRGNPATPDVVTIDMTLPAV